MDYYVICFLISEAETIEDLKNTKISVKTAVKNRVSRLPLLKALLNVPCPPFLPHQSPAATASPQGEALAM